MVGFELRIAPRVRLIESLMTNRYHTTATLLSAVDNLIPGGTTSFGPAGLGRLVVNYNRQELGVYVDLISRLSLRGGHRYVWGDSEVRGSNLSQTGPQETARMKLHVVFGGLTFRPSQKFSANADLEASTAARNFSSTYFRTSLKAYQKARLRAKYQVLNSLALNGGYSYFNNANPIAGFNHYRFMSRETSLSALWTPWGGTRISLLADYTRSTVNSDIQYLIPNKLTAATSSYQDSAHVGTGLLDLSLPKMVKVSAGGSFLRSSGSRPMSYFQPIGKVALPLPRKSQLYAEWRYYGMTDLFYLYQAFRTHQFTVGLHIGL
jgi:hypothetical protein